MTRETRLFSIAPFAIAVLFAIVVALLGGCSSAEASSRYAAQVRFNRWCYNKGRVPIRLTRDEWLCVLPEQAR